MQEVTPKGSEEALANPGMGLYLFGTLKEADMPADAWYAELLNIGYFRDDWTKLQPEGPGKYRFKEYFTPIFDLWVKKWHKRVAFRVMSANMHSNQRYVTPKWVFDAGVPSITHKGLYVPEQVDPVFWDEKYLAIQERFIADLGRYLDGREGLEFIDIGCIGEWGEMHLSRWTAQDLARGGFTQTRYIAAYRRIIDAFARAFPRTRVFLNVGDYETLNDYAAIRGIHFRQDGLTPSGASADVGNRFYRPYARRGIICNYELCYGYDEMKQRGMGVPETFARGLEDPISYLHINLMGYDQLRQAPPDVRQATEVAARRIGFRFALRQLRCNQALRVGGPGAARLLLEQTWRNEGVAPCYDSYALRWMLVDETGKVTAEQLVYPRRPTTTWWPGQEIKETVIVTYPGSLPPRTYRLRVAMVKPETPSLRVQLALSRRSDDGSYELCSLPAQRQAGSAGAIYSEGFEKGAGGWQPTPGISAQVGGGGHGGNGCLLVKGTQPGGAWNYTAIILPEPLRPASRYRLSGWMKVDRIDPLTLPPYLKVGLADARGKFITNCVIARYDAVKMGTWQELWGDVETTPETAGGHLAVEKGSLEANTTVELRLDDVKLELLESP